MSKFSDFNFKGEKALIRVDFNVPLDDKFNITDDTRMTATIPTIKKDIDRWRQRYFNESSWPSERWTCR